MTEQEWRERGKKLFGEDWMQWQFVCPVCKHVASVQDYKNAGAPQNAVAFSCVGRWDATIDCNYAGGGFIRLNPVEVVGENGDTHTLFEFAEAK